MKSRSSHQILKKEKRTGGREHEGNSDNLFLLLSKGSAERAVLSTQKFADHPGKNYLHTKVHLTIYSIQSTAYKIEKE